MSVLSLFHCSNSIEDGFELMGFDIVCKTHKTDGNILGVIGPISNRLGKTVKTFKPLFYLGVAHKNKKLNIDGYTSTLHLTTSEMYDCSRSIMWVIGYMNKSMQLSFSFPEPEIADLLAVDCPDTLLAINVVAAILEAIDVNANIDANTIMSDYEKYYGFSCFNCYLS